MSEQENNKAQAPKARMKGWLRAVLFVSLALNLAVAGLVAGALISGPRDKHRPPRLDQVTGPLTYSLSREDRRDLGRKMRDAYRDGRPSRAEFRAQFDSIVQALRAVPFDPAPVQDGLIRQRAVADARQDFGQTLLLEQLTRMSDAERAGFADRLEEALQHGGRHGSGKYKDR